MSLADEADALIAALAAGDVRRAFELADRLRRSSVEIDAVRARHNADMSRLSAEVRREREERIEAWLRWRDAYIDASEKARQA